ncbi:hypothetical protein RJT34_18846 [Clitoria ternatea]|uniref:RING-type E3 ubiquitin transferase n=1 Tax=Clitoria ternatea TaxID=43366 RepID=A0AAN9IPX8_CLITE
MALNHHNPSYNLPHQTLPHSPQPSSLPIFAIIVPTIFVTAFILFTYLTLVTKCCSNLHQVNPLRWISILRGSGQQEDQDHFIALSPRMWNHGLDESAIREIPTFQFTKEDDDVNVNEMMNHQSMHHGCVVCLTEFQEQDMLKVLPNCSHAFHLDCIDIWLQTNANCPICRSSISGNTPCPLDHIIAPSSSPQNSQLLSNMGSDEDFVVIELGGEREQGVATLTFPRMEQERSDSNSRERLRKIEQKLVCMKPRKCHHHYVSIMGDECIDVRKKDEQFLSVQPIRRSFSMDSANDRQVYLDVQAIIQQQHNRNQNEASGSEDCNISRGRKSFFPFRYGRGSRIAVLPLENGI